VVNQNIVYFGGRKVSIKQRWRFNLGPALDQLHLWDVMLLILRLFWRVGVAVLAAAFL